MVVLTAGGFGAAWLCTISARWHDQKVVLTAGGLGCDAPVGARSGLALA